LFSRSFSLIISCFSLFLDIADLKQPTIGPPVQSPRSLAGFGKKHKEQFSIFSVTNDKSSAGNDFGTRAYQNEEDLNDQIYQLFKTTSSLREKGIIVVNSERIERTDRYSSSCSSSCSSSAPPRRKADFLRFHSSFYLPTTTTTNQPLNGHCDYYGEIHPEFVSQVLFLFKGKVNESIDSDENLGILFSFIDQLRNQRVEHPMGILYSQFDYVLCDGKNMELHKSRWNHESIDYFRETVNSVPLPLLTRAMITVFDELPVLGGYCGKGKNGYCFQVNNGSSSSSSSVAVVPGEEREERESNSMVVKIVLNHNNNDSSSSFHSQIHSEYEKARLANLFFPNHTIAVQSFHYEKEFAGFLFKEFGRSIAKDNCLDRITELFSLLAVFHRENYILGDACIENLVETEDGQLKMIDFATFYQYHEETAQFSRFDCVFADLDSLWLSLPLPLSLPNHHHSQPRSSSSLPRDHPVIQSYGNEFSEDNLVALLAFLENHKLTMI
jgi:hypothetical protein